jgi:hypothetical protein
MFMIAFGLRFQNWVQLPCHSWETARVSLASRSIPNPKAAQGVRVLRPKYDRRISMKVDSVSHWDSARWVDTWLDEYLESAVPVMGG